MSASEQGGTFAAELRRLREAASLTQEELAERAGLTVNAIGALERGERRRPYPHTVRALASALGLDETGRAALANRIPSRVRPGSAAPTLTPTAAGAEAPTESAVLRHAAAPPEPTELIGRDAELALVEQLLLDGRHRLVTLTGPGGVGKTRLATALARRCRDAFPDGVTFVDLAPVREESLVLPAIASAVGLRETAGRPVANALAEFLVGRRLLVVLDNLEHLLGSATDLAGLLAHCPSLVVLGTSRGPLRVRAERELPVPPLPFPGARTVIDSGIVAASPAVRLFLDRSRDAGADLSLTQENASTIAAICRQLEGLPLAIELAAARSRLMPPAALLARLDDALALAGPRDLPERQRTMRATLDWSHQLLAPASRALLRRVAVFDGTFSLDAAEAVCTAGEESCADVLAALSDLQDQALVVPATGVVGSPRYRLLEPVRQYALERLDANGELEVTRSAAADHLLELARDGGPGLRSRAQVHWLDRLADEHGNLRAALSHLLDVGRTDDAASFAWDTWLYWALRGHASETVERADAVAAAATRDVDRSRALAAAAALLYVTGDIPAMRERAAQAVVLARTLDEPALAADAALLAGAAAVFEMQAGEAVPLLADALQLGRQVGAEWTVTHALAAQGQLALLQGDLHSADRLLSDAEATARRLGGPFSLATVLNIRATITELTGDHDASADLLAEALTLSVEASINWTLVYTLPALAGVTARRGHPAEAAQLFGAGAALAEAHSIDPSFPVTRALTDRDRLAVREALGARAFEAAWQVGHAAALADAGALLELAAPVVPARPGAGAGGQAARTRAM